MGLSCLTSGGKRLNEFLSGNVHAQAYIVNKILGYGPVSIGIQPDAMPCDRKDHIIA